MVVPLAPLFRQPAVANRSDVDAAVAQARERIASHCEKQSEN
jgi:hypothetical protein